MKFPPGFRGTFVTIGISVFRQASAAWLLLLAAQELERMMVSIVSNGMSTSGGMGADMDSQSRVAALQTKIKGLIKSIGLIQKQIADEPDPKVKKVLVKMIENLQQTIQTIEQQIYQLERAEQQKEINRIEARRKNEAEGKIDLPRSAALPGN
ncbi:FlxA-like family protein [Rugamonas sp. CCM 8940]|uniref:FlxA-like family protein n=1 Tax=Rugamonas sp. CCM 8940 TaxID=2765359 RepID=UPI0018F6BBEB|nr:FlxA-like family protein [Rugamonas sp. CCM 8940]